ncbi:hypothetical protein J0895_20850 [Phormidium pseudopriestleyi FRX01]|uniref:Uncharacterized protein n=1 Tax=Phormidium pseudopriestleyi FRX01 TaxID=1759528 RepID=A0ABS3FXD4_9CYAN|nr:hypothetical protein [Phormidium pseudopriestleyi]MBO0351482.1 hypothetical protein [Phormidium pseudopriestleyi FRX01]
MGSSIQARSPELRTHWMRSRLYGGGCQPLSTRNKCDRACAWTLHPPIPRDVRSHVMMTPP